MTSSLYCWHHKQGSVRMGGILLLAVLILCSVIGMQTYAQKVLNRNENQDLKKSGGHQLTAQQAAQLAAGLANEECQRLYGKAPFVPETYTAYKKDGAWVWGDTNPMTGVSGYSAYVVFEEGGTNAQVNVIFSVDKY